MLAVLLATLLWLTVAGEHVVERGMRVPLEFRNIPAALEIVGDPPSTVDVRLRGSSALLSRVDPGEIVAVLDLKEARAGSRLFHLPNDQVRAPFGVEVAQVVPGTLALELERSGKRIIPVVPAVEGDPAPGFVAGKVTSQPGTVEVAGPERNLRQLTGATTEPVQITGRSSRVTDVVTIGIADSAIRLVQPQNATVIVEVLPAPVERDLSGVPVRWRNLGTGLRAEVQPSLSRLTVRGRKESLGSLAAGEIEAFVDLAGLGPGRYNLRVQVDPSQSFGITAITPPVVDVTIK